MIFTSSTTSPAIKSSYNTWDNWGHKAPTQSQKRDICIHYVHVCEQVRWACSAEISAIENLCIIIIIYSGHTALCFAHTDLRPVECLGMGYTQPYAKHRDYIKGGVGVGGLSHPCVKGAARRALFRVLHMSARHMRTASPTSSSSHWSEGVFVL